ncbi:MAG: glycosyltransferase [Acidobacteria bacterium]|nr:glycosyltransferase [Acidobacteriota bacterium]
MAAGVPVWVLAAACGRRPDLVQAGPGDPLPPVSYLGGRRRTAATGSGHGRAAAGRPAALMKVLARDLLRLGGRPRPCARALRLGLYAWRGVRLLPPGGGHLHDHFANDAAALARYLAAAAGLSYSLTAHAYDLYQDPFLLVPNLAAARRVFTVSRANLEFLRGIPGGVSAERLRLLHCGLDLARLPYRDPPPLTVGPARIVCVARLVPKKGHQVLLAAVAQLRTTGRELDLCLIGEGPEEGAIRTAVDRLGLGGQVRLAGAMGNRETLAELSRADLCVLPARVAADGDRDGLPVVLMEAGALGVPLAVSRVGGIPELVDEDSGWTAAADDPRAFAAAMAAALDAPPAERTARARRTRARVEAEFDVAGQVDALTAAFS